MFYAFLLLVAGNETTTNLLGMVLLNLAQNPDLFAELKADRSLLPAAVDEVARWGSPVQWAARTLTAPYSIDIHRRGPGRLAFGHGLHFCLGAHLARLEVTTAIDQLFDDIDGLELAVPITWATTPHCKAPHHYPSGSQGDDRPDALAKCVG